MVPWHHGFKILVRKYYGEESMVEPSSSQCGSKEADQEEVVRNKIQLRLQGCVPNGLLLPVGPTY
jgi:hypothetical protein